MEVSVTFTLSLPFAVKKEKRYFISCCPILDIWSQGGTKEKALLNLKEAVQLFLIDCFEHGTLDQVLKGCGFVASKKRVSKARRPQMMDILLPFVIDQQMARCHD